MIFFYFLEFYTKTFWEPSNSGWVFCFSPSLSLSLCLPMVLIFMTWIPCSSIKNSNCFFTYFQSFKEGNNIMGDSIFWLAVYLLSRVTPLFPAIFFFGSFSYSWDKFAPRLFSFCTSSCWRLPIWCEHPKVFFFATFCGSTHTKRNFCLLAEEFPFILLANLSVAEVIWCILE